MDADYREVCKRLAARHSETEIIKTTIIAIAENSRILPFPYLCLLDTLDPNQYLKASSTNGSTA